MFQIFLSENCAKNIFTSLLFMQSCPFEPLLPELLDSSETTYFTILFVSIEKAIRKYTKCREKWAHIHILIAEFIQNNFNRALNVGVYPFRCQQKTGLFLYVKFDYFKRIFQNNSESFYKQIKYHSGKKLEIDVNGIPVLKSFNEYLKGVSTQLNKPYNFDWSLYFKEDDISTIVNEFSDYEKILLETNNNFQDDLNNSNNPTNVNENFSNNVNNNNSNLQQDKKTEINHPKFPFRRNSHKTEFFQSLQLYLNRHAFRFLRTFSLINNKKTIGYNR